MTFRFNNSNVGVISMGSAYNNLNPSLLNQTITLYKPSHLLEGQVSLNDPAMYVFTDFQRITPLTIEASASIERANEKMINCGVRLLFVCDDNDNIEGLITADDILGEKPVQYLREHGGCRQDILVLDIMTRQNKLECIDIQTIMDASVGDIVETIKQTGRHHLLVGENINDRMILRGIFSRTQVCRQIGKPIKFTNRANSFAELEMALVANG